MRRQMILVALVAYVVTAVQCANIRAVRHLDIEAPQSLRYVHDTAEVPDKRAVTVRVSSVRFEKTLPESPTITKRKNTLVPHPALGLFVYWFYFRYGSIFDYELASKSIQEDPATFFEQELIQEAQRSGNFALDSAGTDCDYELDVTVRDQSVTGPYEMKTTVLCCVSYTERWKAGPARAVVECDMKLTSKRDGIVLEKSLKNEEGTEFLAERARSNKELQQRYTIAMVEALSTAYKETIEQIVSEVNASIEGS